MSRIRGKDTSIERMLSRELWHRGLRFRKNSRYVYGHPDISIRKYRIAIFCDGDFWHGRNIAKDIETNHVLASMGYTVIRIWEHDIRNDLKDTADMIMRIVSEKKAQAGR